MFKYFKKYALFGIIAPLFMFGEVFMDLLQPQMMKTIVDDGVLGLGNSGIGNINLIIKTGIQMISIVILGGIFGVLSGVFANLFSQNLGNSIRKACFKRVMEFSFEQTDKFSTGSLVTRITNDVTQLQNLATQCVRGFIRTTMLFFGGIFCVCVLDISFGVILAITLPFLIGLVIFFIVKATPFFDVLQKKLDKVNTIVQENVAGARIVRASVRENYEKERFFKANADLSDTQLKVLNLFSYMTPLVNIALNIVGVIIIKVGAIEVSQGIATPGSIMAAITYISQIMHSVIMLAGIFQTFSRGTASGKRLNEILKTSPIIKDGNNVSPSQTKGKICFKDVSFYYPQGSGEYALKNINITINSGETFGILGATGSGKSTFISLIPRFYDATEGNIFIDDINVRDYKLSDLREKIAIALQKSELFSTTIKENILFGKTNATSEEIEKASENAQAIEFINAHPQGYDTPVAEKGMSLSGGQKQRIALSRALLKKSEILIFDDATSALDLKTEENLYKALKKDYSSATKIIIAQRISSVKDADRIAIMDNGKIIACDTHDNLLKYNDIYKDIYRIQLGGKIGNE